MKWKPRHKYGAIACERDGIKFPSKLERACYDYLQEQKKQGKIRLVLRQVGLDLPCSDRTARHFVDFLVFRDNDCLFIEAKGREHEAGKVRRETASAIYDVPIHVVKSVKELMALLMTS